MTIDALKASILAGEYHSSFRKLYGDEQTAVSRYVNLCDYFMETFGWQDKDNLCLFSAPGRTEIGGNHTDHQHGRVLAASVNLDIIAAVSPNDSGIIRLQSEGYEMNIVHLSSLSPMEDERERSNSLIRGVCARLAELGYTVGGFDAYTMSDVLKGSGLSSSAAFEVLIGTILSHLYNDGKIDTVTIAKAAQYAENRYFGKPSGLMDQTACATGGFVAIDFQDPEHPVIEKIDFDFQQSGYSLCIVDTKGNHADLTDEYAAIPREMKSVASCFGKEYLWDVDEQKFYNSIGAVREKCGDRAVLRTGHFFAENKRAMAQRDALTGNRFDEFLRLVSESGRSSFMYLQNVYAPGAVSQGLSLGLFMSDHLLNGRGAFRVHGGGFAGTIQAFVPHDLLAGYQANMEKVFGSGSCYSLSVRLHGGIMLTI